MELNPFNRKELQKEFPFLKSKDISKAFKKAEECCIRRVDETFLVSEPPATYYHDGSCGCTEKYTKIWFVMDDGQVLENCVKVAGEWSSNYAYSSPSSWEGERYIDALFKMEKIPEYIVIYASYESAWSGSEEVESYSIEIRKLGKDAKRVLETFEKEQAKAAQQVAAAMSELD